ncbi:FAD-dependent oxidoreductase [Streptomyces sp. NPDC057684]|uniref:FAD-dependent oxidoreductase n=1 Tax=Streptomyces sp. NPDC057684 TaxID=3346211 RepID=UPI003697A09B
MNPDIVVVGGGTAGVAAAVAAARAGARTLLVERYGSLGGTLTSVSLGSLCGYFTVREGKALPVVGGLAEEIVRALQDRDGIANPKHWLRTASLPYDLFTMRLVLDDLTTAGDVADRLEVRLHSLVTGVELAGPGDIRALHLAGKDGRTTIFPRLVIDCSGDADVAAAAGLGFDMAVDELQTSTTMFRFGGVDTAIADRIGRTELHDHLRQAADAGLRLPRTAGGMYSVRPGVVHLNITKIGPFDPLSPVALTAAELEGRRQVADYLAAFREFVPGFADAFVLDCGHTIGVRESRRIHGRATVTEAHIRTSGRCADVVACSAWPVEEHIPGGETAWSWLEPGEFYQVPFGALVPRDSRNVLVAGRSASATHRAQASLRVAAQCFATGEAAGTAAAQLVADGARDVDAVDVGQLQRSLLNAGAFLGPPYGPEFL